MTTKKNIKVTIPLKSFNLLLKKSWLIFLTEYYISNNLENTKQERFYLGWGRKKSGLLAVKKANLTKSNYVLLEDGFLRSYERNEKPLSIIYDTLGIYYDANHPSRLENLIKNSLSKQEHQTTIELISSWQKNYLSKYNHLREYSGTIPKEYILVCDQTFGDESIKYGLANEKSFKKMIQSAISNNPNLTILVKVHPDSLSKNKRGYFDISSLTGNKQIKLITQACSPVKLLKNATAVYTVTSQLGFEALIWRKKVYTFGMPFYAGWGLTTDYLPAPNRRKNVSLQQLIYAALVRYPQYIDPIKRTPSHINEIINYISLQKKSQINFPKNITALNFSPWKRSFLRCFMKKSKIDFIYSNKIDNNQDNTYLIWGRGNHPNISDKDIIRVEDGFLRSVGLGASLTKPTSLVFDNVGIYFDATTPSKLENILHTQKLSTTELERSKLLIKKIIKAQITKYNIATLNWQKPKTDKKIILVVGQVEDDSSIKYGSPKIKTNIELLKHVQQNNPNSYIIYKPHPDVLKGLRKSGKNEHKSKNFCDEIINNVDIKILFETVDEVHTMTSLLGFEALLRNIKVLCYGIPFYASWGLTTDLIKCPRRKKMLSLEELVYGALISYPYYYDYKQDSYINVEQCLNLLIKAKKNIPRTKLLWNYILSFISKVKNKKL